ncbi:MAG TPA: hypothetical protein VME70_12000 [Mycobacteriales bacterium]|nr:hypothetical protein [Mycobacteriales bacterium]
MTTRDERLAPADRRMFWRWVGDGVRPYLGWALVVLGAVALFLGWYGVSGQALTAKQLPYLVSGGLSGIALVLIGAVLLATDNLRRNLGRLDGVERKVDDLYALLVAEPVDDAGAGLPPETAQTDPTPSTSTSTSAQVPSAGTVVAVPGGTTYHRPNCELVEGKPDAAPVDGSGITARSLHACPVCEPGQPTSG